MLLFQLIYSDCCPGWWWLVNCDLIIGPRIFRHYCGGAIGAGMRSNPKLSTVYELQCIGRSYLKLEHKGYLDYRCRKTDDWFSVSVSHKMGFFPKVFRSLLAWLGRIWSWIYLNDTDVILRSCFESENCGDINATWLEIPWQSPLKM